MNESSKANEQADDKSAQSMSGAPSEKSPDPAISSADYTFAEPQLDAAQISEDVAQRVDLEAAEAEAARVEHEAQLATQGISTSIGEKLPAPDFKAPEFQAPKVPEPEAGQQPEGDAHPDPEESVDWDSASTVLRTDFSKPPVATNPWSKQASQAQSAELGSIPSVSLQKPDQHSAAVEPVAQEDQPTFPAQPPAVPAPSAADSTPTTGGADPAPAAAPHIGAGIDDGHGWRRPETPWQQSGTPWQPKANPWQSPSQLARSEAEAAALAAATASVAPVGDPQDASGAPPTGSHQGQQPPSAGPQPYAPGAYGQPAASGGQPPYGTPHPYGAPNQQGAPRYGGGLQPAGPGVPPVPGYPGGPQGPNYGGPGGPQGPQGPQGPGYGGPQGPYGGPGGPQGPGGPSGSNKKKLFIILAVVVVGLGLIALFVTLLAGLFASSATKPAPVVVESSQPTSEKSTPATSSDKAKDPEAGLILPELSPLKWLEGDCLRGFKDASTPADVVVCSSPHNAQLVGTFYYNDAEKFPGLDALKAKAAEVCSSVQLTSESGNIKTLKQSTAYPSEASWNDKDDRRVDCMVSDTRAGNPLETSVTK
ncbi:hypothetical protein [Arthrobacter sp. E3]|uniref:hypothetical protein n=1 Tax=Arthrobacter sp. E3 TaxID=517402 RepID=UPI001A953631|nr:hypothetical protein [Arthrobacter sp. E3]